MRIARGLLGLAVLAACGGDDPAVDAAPIDAMVDAAEVDAPVDADPDAVPVDASVFVNNCTPALAVDARDPAAARVIRSRGLLYEPGCLRIAAGQSVTFSSDFLSHPLIGGTLVAGGGVPDPTSPIASTTSGATATFTFPTAGVYPFYCTLHAADGMGGAIYVE